MEQGKDLIVTLTCYRGKVTLDLQHNISSEHAPIKLVYGRLEWINFMKSAKIQYSKIDIAKVNEETISYKDGKDLEGKSIKIRESNYKEIEASSEMIEEVNKVMADPSKKLTPEQEIEQLKSQMAEMVKANSNTEVKNVVTETKEVKDSDSELEAWRFKYEQVTGQKAHQKAKAETLEKKIEEYLNK